MTEVCFQLLCLLDYVKYVNVKICCAENKTCEIVIRGNP